MAKIRDLHDELIPILCQHCPECTVHLTDFFFAVVSIDSLVDGAFDSFGYYKNKRDEIKRRWYVELNCQKTVNFCWKKAEIYDVKTDCEPQKNIR